MQNANKDIGMEMDIGPPSNEWSHTTQALLMRTPPGAKHQANAKTDMDVETNSSPTNSGRRSSRKRSLEKGLADSTTQRQKLRRKQSSERHRHMANDDSTHQEVHYATDPDTDWAVVPWSQRDHLPKTQRPESPRDAYKRARSGSVRGSHRSNEDPREYLISSKREEAISCIPKRMHSLKLPLERVPSGMDTVKLTTTLDVTMEDCQNAMEQCAASDSYIADGIQVMPLDFRHMDDVMDVDDRLRESVWKWAEDQGDGMEFEFTLRSQVKGKQRAE